jgi:hypothetical protein
VDAHRRAALGTFDRSLRRANSASVSVVLKRKRQKRSGRAGRVEFSYRGQFTGHVPFHARRWRRERISCDHDWEENTHACAPDSTKLVALGNEAVQCKNTHAQGQTLDVIAGHVRQLFFVVSAANIPNAAKAPSAMVPPDSYAASVLERIVEQVVGNLY